MIFIHGDLPLLVPEEIEALIQAAGGGCALAPDRHGSGTNAIALMAAAPFEFAFGENSLALHRTTSGRRARSEEHTSELQSLMRISYAVFCLKQTTTHVLSDDKRHQTGPNKIASNNTTE